MADLRYCIQCTDRNSGKIGSFLFNPAESTPGNLRAVSPVFNGLVPLYEHMKKNNIKALGPGEQEPWHAEKGDA